MFNAARIITAMLLAFAVGACFFVPGRFVSDMTVGADSGFTFAYRGEIVLASSPDMLDGQATTFTPVCRIGDEDSAERPCSASETAKQRTDWTAKRERDKREAGKMAAMFGGIDPSDPATMDAFAAKLARQAGWKSVVHKGNGVFAVDYAVIGTLDRDFVWPVFPRIDFVKPFVVAQRRANGSVMVRAPGYSSDNNEMMRAMSMGSVTESQPAKPAQSRPQLLSGSFTITTDGEVLTNNTDEGPKLWARSGGWCGRSRPISRRSPKRLSGCAKFQRARPQSSGAIVTRNPSNVLDISIWHESREVAVRCSELSSSASSSSLIVGSRAKSSSST